MNNVLWINGGFGIDVTSDATGSLTSDYNDIHRGIVPDGQVGRWAGVEAADLDDGTASDWRSLSGQDLHSRSVDPGFIDIDGADNVFGWVALEGKDGGLDDNFHVGGGSPIIDAAYSDAATLTDRDGLGRHNDLGMPDTGSGIFSYYDLGCYEFQSSTNDVTSPTVELVLPLPAEGETTTASFTHIAVTFSEAMDWTAANSPDNYELIASGGDGRFDDGGEFAVELTPSYTIGDLDVTLAWGGAPLPSDFYRLTLFSTETAFLADVAGNKLDGNEDGPDSDSYIRTFGVDYDPPVVDHIVPAGAVAAGPTAIEVVFDEANAMADATVENKANYALMNSGGDDDLDNGGTDISALIDSVSYDAPTKTATLSLSAPLPAERYRLTVGAGITDAEGRPLNGGTAQSFDFLVDGIAPVGELVTPAPGSLTGTDLGYVEVRWNDADGVGIDPATIGADDVTVTGVTVDDAIDLGAGLYRYVYDLDADALTPGPVTVSFVAGAAADLAGNPNPGGSEQFAYDTAGPLVTAVTPVLTAGELTGIVIDFNERLEPAAAADASNYRLVASGGDAAFDDGTDVNLSARVTSAAYDDGLRRVTLTVAPALPDEAYRLTVVAGGVEDLAGNPLNDGADEVRDFVVNENVAAMSAALRAGDDTGAPGDGITHETDLAFDVVVNEAGTIAADYDDDSVVDEEVLAAGPGTYTLTGGGTFAEGLYTVGVDFTDTAGGVLHEDVPVEVDTTGPQVTGAEGVPEMITITFDEDLDPSAAGDAGNYQLIWSGPNGVLDGIDDVTVPATPAYTPGGTTVTLTGAGDFDEGLYELTVRGTTSVTDVAGNRLNDGAGDYVEEITVTSAVPPEVVGTDPAQDEAVLSLPSYIEVTFSKPIDELSVGTGDLEFGGSAVVSTTVISVDKVSDTTWRYNICPACGTEWTTGVVEVTVPAGAVTDAGGRPVEEYGWSFPYDPTAPQAELDIWPDHVLPENTTDLTVDFTEPVAAVTPADVQLVESSLGVVTPDSVALAPDGLSATLSFTAGLQAAAAFDTYTLTVFDTVQDVVGHALDGDGNGSGGGDYVVLFSVLIVGDANGDGQVGIADLSAVADNYGGSPVTWTHGDFNHDGDVGIADLSAVADNYGRNITGGRPAGGQATEPLDAPDESAPDALAIAAGGSGGLTYDAALAEVSIGPIAPALPAVPLAPQAGGGSAMLAGQAAEDAPDPLPNLDDLTDLLAGPSLNVLP